MTALSPQRAAADQVGDLKAQARSIEQKLVLEQLQIDAYQQQYAVDSAKVAADAQSIADVGQQIGQDEQQINADTVQVRQLAITSYMNGGVLSGSEAALFEGNAEEVQSADEYDAIATGNIESALNALQSAQEALEIQHAALRQQQMNDQTEQSQEASALSQADSTESAMESEQGLVTGRLASAVAAQTAALDAAAAAAVSAAQKGKGGSKTGAGGTKGGTAVGVGPPIADPALPPYLQCVVRAESGGNYGAVSPGGTYMGAFQFSQSTWDFAARAAGLLYLVGVPPNHASKAEQDTVAIALFALDGDQPWLGDRCVA